MNIVCPNCEAKYLFKTKEKKLVGQKIQCSNCKQKWFQYNLYNEKKVDIKKNNSLKEIALEEYRISTTNKDTISFNNRKTIENVKTRLQESSARLEKSKRELGDSTIENPDNSTFVDNSALIGFLIVSLMFISFGLIYIYNDEIQKLFPGKVGLLSDYRKLIDHGVRIAQDLITLALN